MAYLNARGKRVKVSAATAAQLKKYKRRPRRSVAAVVKRIIKGQEEKKMQSLSTAGTTFNGAISGTGEWYNPIPIVGQGTGAFQRDGNVIKPSLLDMHWRISLGTGVTRSCDDTVVLYLFKCKNLRSYADMVARGSAGVFLDKGSLGLSSFTGILNDVDTPINNDAFVVIKKKVFKLTKGPGALNGDVGNYNGAGGTTSRHINIKIRKLPQFMYQQGNADGLPENYGLCWALGYAKSDGSSPDVINQDLRVDFTSNLFFTDA